MSSGKRPTPGHPRRRRPPTVINLEATEVPSAPPESGMQTDARAEATDNRTSSEPAASAVTLEPALAEPSTGEPSAAKPSTAEPQDAPAAPDERAHASPEPPRIEPPPGPTPDQPTPERNAAALAWSPLAAALAGAVSALAVVLLLWLFGAFAGGGSVAVDVTPRLAVIERQLQELATRPAPPTADPRVVEELAARLAQIERTLAAPRAPVTDPVVLGRLSSTENAVKSVADNVAGLSRRDDRLEAALRDLQNRLEALSVALGELKTTAHAAAAGSDRAARLALAATALRSAVEQGTPFAPELAAVKSLRPDASGLEALEPFAASGIPSNAALGAELAAVIRPLLRAAPSPAPPRDGGFIDRLQANAEKLVRIRPLDEARGDDQRAVLARIEQNATRGDLAAALAELDKVPQARAAVEAWLRKYDARGKAIEAGRQLAREAMAALGTPP